MANHLSQQISEKAKSLGISGIGFSQAMQLYTEREHLKAWLKNQYHADMQWMERNLDKRTEPEKLFPGAKTVISVMLNYKPAEVQSADTPQIAKYAYGRDYHKVLKKKLHLLIDFLHQLEPNARARAFVDSAPVLEHAWAQHSGLGWIGKHSLLINRKYGSYILLGEIITNLQIGPSNNQMPDLCGSCTRCIDACPTGAIVKPYVVDARKCISYHTIENKGELPAALQEKFGKWAFGCDICQDVCPYNKSTPSHAEDDFIPKKMLLQMAKKNWYELSGEGFFNVFSGTPVMRAKHSGFKRNLRFIEKNFD